MVRRWPRGWVVLPAVCTFALAPWGADMAPAGPAHTHLAQVDTRRLGQPRAPEVRVRIEETRLAQLPPDWQDMQPRYATSLDGRHFAYVLEIDGRRALAIDGAAGPDFDEIGGLLVLLGDVGHRECAAFSTDGERAAYTGRRGTSWFAVIDGEIGPPYDEIRLYPASVFSSSGERYAYAARRGENWMAVVDGREGEGFAEVIGPAFGGSGEHLVYTASDATGTTHLFIDGRWHTEPRTVRCAILSPDGSRFAYVVPGATGHTVCVDGEFHQHFGEVDCHTITWSHDSKHLAYVTYAGARKRVIIDGQVQAEYERVGRPVFRPGSGELWYDARQAGTAIIVRDGQAVAKYDDVQPFLAPPVDWRSSVFLNMSTIRFSTDGTRVAYSASRAGQWFTVVDGVEGPPYAHVTGGRFSPDAQRLAYWAALEGPAWVVVTDGRASQTWDGARITPVFSPDGLHIAYGAHRGKLRQDQYRARIVVDDEVGPACQMVSDPVFSPDSSHVAYAAFADGQSWMVFDGEAGPRYDAIPGPAVCSMSPVFRPDGTLEYLAVRADTLYRVRHVPPNDAP
ncbi:MAG TPA: hypothetical protein DGT21_13010 [Armatimonadetes bacterium]|nr:hypothetical protein [Armatimonadota bacterium]